MLLKLFDTNNSDKLYFMNAMLYCEYRVCKLASFPHVYNDCEHIM